MVVEATTSRVGKLPKASVDARTSKATGEQSFRVRWREGGRQLQETFLDVDSALEFKRLVETMGTAAARKVLRARHSADGGMPTLAEFTERYLDRSSGLLTGIEDGTRAGYEKIAAKSFLVVLGQYPLDVITKSEIGQWVAWQETQPSLRRKGENMSAKTIRNYHALLSSIFSSAVEQKLITENPAYRTRLTRGVKKEATFLTAEEYQTILHFIPDRYKRLVEFLANSGARWGEATAITWGDLNPNGKPPTVRIVKAWKKARTGAPVLGTTKSAKGRRTVSLPPTLIAALGEPGPADALVFPGVLSGGHIWYQRFRESNWNKAVSAAQSAEACEAAGLTPITKTPTIHDLRHSHASWLIAAGMPLPYIQSRLGHEKITTTVDVYGHLVPDAHEQMAAVIAETLAAGKRVTAPPAVAQHAPVAEVEAMEVLEGELVDV
ncbi:site-specific integrase [Microbacterium sp. BG28]|uniref:tyrosine-type recombinase/integrase n=1 Tax=Microbacterium sp. BG28 TaxID=3097356 RepID=UPI002A5A3061|nr:site-specific integrase [Microbacterium sp. BG28]MDY0829151.1 site-specific integrase [Microbacterium sp. BG28]